MGTSVGRRPRFLVVGSANIDLTFRLSRIPAAGENLIARDCVREVGGKGANQAIALARLGMESELVACVGYDDGDIVEALEREGVLAQSLVRLPMVGSGTAIILLLPDGENRIVVHPGANLRLRPQDVELAIDQAAVDALLVQFELAHDTILAACAAARRRGIPIYVDAGPAQDFPLEELGPVAVLSPNESEAERLCGRGCDDLTAARDMSAALAQRARADAVVLKLGSRGATWWSREGLGHVPARRVDAIDTTAAGDAFTAAFAVAHLRTGDLELAVGEGNIAGALAATVLGAQASLPTAAAIERFRAQCAAGAPS